MKKVVSLLLLSLFLYGSAGIFIAFKFQEHAVKKEIKRKIKTSVPEVELILISIHPGSKEYGELNWLDDHEFRYKGQMFDIVRKITDPDGTLHFYCVNDKQEEKLFANLDQWVQNNMDDNDRSNSASKNILKVFSNLYFQHSPSIVFPAEMTSLSRKEYSQLYLSPSAEIAFPPPKTA